MNAKPYTDNITFKGTSFWLYFLTGFRKTERDIWRAGFGARKYIVRYWIFWIFKIEECKVFGRCDW